MDHFPNDLTSTLRPSTGPWLEAQLHDQLPSAESTPHSPFLLPTEIGKVGATKYVGEGDAFDLHAALMGCMDPGKRLSVQLTNNRQTIVSVHRSAARYEVRIHRIFGRAPEPVVSALGKYIAYNDQVSANVLGEFIEQHREEIASVPVRGRLPRIRTAGSFHDLQQIFDTLNATYFDSACAARITWGARLAQRKRQSIKIGSYVVEDGLIRIHPALDQREVPPLFVAWVVYHEMLHAKHPVTVVGQRRCFHPASFIEDEKRFVGYREALAWQAKNLTRLLDS